MKGDPSIFIEMRVKDSDMMIKDFSSVKCHKEIKDT
jgi:hypothetical protein